MRAKRAGKNSRGGQKLAWGGTDNFGDGGGQVQMGGDYPLMGGGPPHPPPIVGHPGGSVKSNKNFSFSSRLTVSAWVSPSSAQLV